MSFEINKFFSKILAIIIFLFSSFFIFYIYYRNKYFYTGEGILNVNIYYFLGLIGIFISLLVLFLPNKISKSLTIIGFISILAIYILEYSINFINFKDSKRIYLAKKNGVIYDTRTITEVVKDLKKKTNKKVSIAYPASGYIPPNGIKIQNKYINPLSGISDSLTVVCNESGKWSTYLSDRYGFNNPDYIWDKKNIDIILIGDSYVHGDCVKPKNNISGNLRNITGKNVLNLAFRGNSPYSQYATLKEYAIKKNPKNIFWFFSEENDLEDISRDKNKKILTDYLKNDDHHQNLENKQYLIDKALQNLYIKINFTKNVKLQNIRKFFLERLIIRLFYKDSIEKQENEYKQGKKRVYLVNEKNFQAYSEIIQKVNYITKEKNINLNLVYMPSWERYINTDYTQLIKKFHKLTDKLDINFINLDEDLFNIKKDPLIHFPFKINSHYNEETYKDISKILVKYIN